MAEDDELKSQRAILFALLISRLRSVRFPKTPPESYYVGQEYIEDTRRPACTLITSVLQAARCEPFSFWHKNAKVEVIQHGARLYIRVDRKIPQRLFDEMRILGIGHEFIVSYMSLYIPMINERLLNQKYKSSNFLIRTFSLYDLIDIGVVLDGKAVRFPWPWQFPAFPTKTTVTALDSHVYIRYYIDSSTSYFNGDYDECIRKVITSIENFIREKGWRLPKEALVKRAWLFLNGRSPSSRVAFRRIINHYVPISDYRGDAVNFNIQQLYSLRNRIVHNSFRASGKARMFCDKAVSTLYYFLILTSGDNELNKLLAGTRSHFVMMQHYEEGRLNLDDIERRQKQQEAIPAKPISTPEEFDRHMFSALKFTQSDLLSVS